MTDRIKGYIVTLAKDTRVDDAEAITNAIAMVKGVLKVEPLIADAGDVIERARIRAEFIDKLWEALK